MKTASELKEQNKRVIDIYRKANDGEYAEMWAIPNEDYKLLGTGISIDSKKAYPVGVASNQPDGENKVFVDGILLNALGEEPEVRLVFPKREEDAKRLFWDSKTPLPAENFGDIPYFVLGTENTAENSRLLSNLGSLEDRIRIGAIDENDARKKMKRSANQIEYNTKDLIFVKETEQGLQVATVDGRLPKGANPSVATVLAKAIGENNPTFYPIAQNEKWVCPTGDLEQVEWKPAARVLNDGEHEQVLRTNILHKLTKTNLGKAMGTYADKSLRMFEVFQEVSNLDADIEATMYGVISEKATGGVTVDKYGKITYSKLLDENTTLSVNCEGSKTKLVMERDEKMRIEATVNKKGDIDFVFSPDIEKERTIAGNTENGQKLKLSKEEETFFNRFLILFAKGMPSPAKKEKDAVGPKAMFKERGE